MKKKNNDLVDKAEIVENPSAKYQEIKQINEELLKLSDIESNLSSRFDVISDELCDEVSYDKDLLRKDTIEFVKRYLDKIIKEFNIFKDANPVIREKLYYKIHAVSLLFFDYCHRMRKSNFSIHATKYLTWVISVMDSNVILSGVKYLDWRVKLYCELASCYEDYGAFSVALKVINQALSKLTELKQIEEQQVPLPEYIRLILLENQRILRVFEAKYSIYSGSLLIDAWKKKVDDGFSDDKFNKLLCIMNCVSNLSKHNSIIYHDGLKITWKISAIQYAYELMKGDIMDIKRGILEFIEKKRRNKEKNSKINESQGNYQTIIEQYKETDDKIIKKSVWKNAIRNVPLELHIELLKACFDCKLWKEFLELIEPLLVRIKYRRVEEPYISDLDIQVSSIQYSNVPNKYERIPIDLNINNFKKEIRRLTEQGKYLAGGKRPESKQETKTKPGQKPPQTTGKKPEIKEEKAENPYEEIEGLEHEFVYILVKRTHNPMKAIIDINFQLGNSKLEGKLGQGERAVAVPLKLYDQNSEKKNLSPYLIYRKTMTGLKNEEEQLSAITDIKPIISNSPFCPIPMFYKKLDFELTNYQIGNTYNFNHNYVYTCVKTDEIFYIIEKETSILKNLYELELTYLEKGTNEYNNLKKTEKFLNLNFDLEKLEAVSSLLYSGTLGPIGIYFLKERRNFFYDICNLLWTKYLKEFLNKVDYFYDIENEIEETEKLSISDKLNFIRKQLYTSIYNIHSVLTKVENKDIILYTVIASRLADLCESSENFNVGVNSLKNTLDYINIYKENIYKCGVDSEKNYHSFTTFTCDNNKIKNLYDSINNKYEEYVRKLNFKRRKQYRNINGLNKLSVDEEYEENFESILLEKEYEEKYLKSNNPVSNEKQDKFMFLKENDNIMNCMCVDLTIKYYRLYIKCEFVNKYNTVNKSIIEDLSSIKSSSSSLSKTKNSRISEKTLKKLDIIKGQTATQVKKNMDFLKNSLQEAGKMDPDKPVFERYEKEMLFEIGKNGYLNVIFKLMMANFRTGKQDQKYLFLEALDNFKKVMNEENDRYRYFEENFFYIKAAENINKNKMFTQNTFYPYNLLYKEIMIDNYEKIPEPILIHKTQTSASFIFPKIRIKRNNLDEKYNHINKVALYGQLSSGTNIVALHNKNLNGTGKIISMLDYQTVSQLKPNEKYIFAYAGYDNENVLVGQIGNTSKEVEAYFPLPLFYIAFYLSKMTYEYGHFEICKEISKMVFNNFTEKSDIKDTIYDNKILSVFFYKLRYNYISRTCYFELEGVAYCFYFFAKSILNLKKSEHSDNNGVNISQKQKNIIKNINILLLGLEIASYIRHFNLIKLFTEQIYSIAEPLIKQKNRIPNLHNVFLRCSLSINLIPSELWDVKFRTISSLIDYQILMLLINVNEIDIFKKVLMQEIGLPKRKFINFTYNYLKKQEDPKGKKPANEKDKKNQPVQAEEEKFVETPGYLIKEMERESSELDEFVISLYDFNDIMRTKLSQLTNKLDNKYGSIIEFAPELEKRKKEISEILDIWEGFKAEGVVYLKKFATTFRDTEKYYEICAGLIKRSIEIAKVNNINDVVKTMDDIVIKDIDGLYISELFKQKMNFLCSDIVYSMKLRIKEFLDKIEKNEAKSQTPTSGDINLDKIRLKIEEKYFGSSIENEKVVPFKDIQLNEVYILKEKYFWIGDIMFQKSVVSFYEYIMSHPTFLNFDFNNFLNYKLVDLQKLAKMNNEDKIFVDYRLQDDKYKDLRTKKLSKIFEKISNALLFLNEVSSYSLIDNIIIFSYNILMYEMMCPNDTMKDNMWSYLVISSEIAIKRLDFIKSGKLDFKQIDYEIELRKLKERLGNTSGIKTQSNFSVPKKNVETERTSELDEETLIENYKLKVNLDTYVQFITFTIQCVYTAGKWNILADIIQKFNDVTNDHLGDFTLEFLIEAQSKLFEKAALNTNNKKNECQQRVAAFETWKNSRKKNKRQQMITGEIPQEQIDFEREYTILSKELYILESIENLLKADKEKSEKKLTALLNDSNNCSKTLTACRKLFERYQMEAFTLNLDITSKGSEHFDVKSKKKALKLFANSIIANYKKAIQILKKRQENYLLIQALFEMSILHYSDEDLKNAEIYFNEALDTVFQKLYSLREFRSIFENIKNVAEKYQIRPLFYAIMVLHKLLKFCYDNDLYKQRECCLMSSEIIYQILIPYLPNPVNILSFSMFRISEIHKNINVFEYTENIKPALILEACVDINEILISYGDYDKCLPILSLQEYISCDIIKSVPYLLKTRIQRIICLAELGFINEAMQNYYKIVKKLDLPSVIPFTTFNERNIGKYSNSSKEIKYYNNLPPEHQKNQEAITSFSRLNPDTEVKNSLGNNYHCELIYAKCLVIFRIYEKENYAIYLEKSDNRLEYYLRIQGDLKEILLNIAAGEELTNLISLLNYLKAFPEKKEQLDWTQRKIDEIVQSKRLMQDELNNFYLAKFNKNEIDLRVERLELIYKIRFLISRIYSSQSLYLTSTSVLLKLIKNIQSLCSNRILGVENGEDFAFDFKLPDANQAKGGKNVAPEKKPDPKDKKNQVQLNINLDEELNKLLMSGYQEEGKRSHPNPVLWLKTQYLLLLNYFKQNRINDCFALIEKNCQLSPAINDIFYLMRFKEIEIYLNIYNYDLDNVNTVEEQIKSLSKNYFTNDYEFGFFLANQSEFLMKTGRKDEALSKIKESRRILWSKLGKMNYFLNNQSFSDKNIIEGLEIDKEIKQTILDRENSIIVPVVGKKGAEPAKKKDEPKQEISPINFNQIVNFQDGNKNKEIIFEKVNVEMNNSDEGSNLYFKFTDIICRIDLKYCLYLLNMNNCDLNLIQSVIGDVETLYLKILYPHNSIPILINYVLGKFNKMLFITSFNKFIEEKMQPIIKKNKIDVIKPDILQKLSNYYNERCTSIWLPLLNKSKEYFEKTIRLMKNEYYTIESGINLYNILIELGDVCLLLAENRPIKNPKFIDLNQIVNKVNNIYKKKQFYDKENDDLPYIGDDLVEEGVKNEKLNWTNERIRQEKLKVKNYLKEFVYLMETANKVFLNKKFINENTQELALTNLIDPSKIPKDLYSQLLEYDYLNKKKNKHYLTNIQIKPVPESSDVLYLLRNLSRECEFFTIQNEENLKNLSKLHKYLRMNCTNYNSKVYMEVVPYTDFTDLNIEIIKKDQIIISWIEEYGQNYLIYLIGPNSTINDMSNYNFARIPFNKEVVFEINRTLFDMRNVFKTTLTYTEQKKQRDLKYLQSDYKNQIMKFSSEMMKRKEFFTDLKKLETIIKKEYLGDISIENLDFWINLTMYPCYNSTIQRFNALFNDLHQKLFS